MGIGIHQGDAFVGNIGSPRRLEFTLIGDTVNVANRLCGLAQGDELLVSETIAERLTTSRRLHLRCRSRDDVQVERRHRDATRVWQVERSS
jgi:adenylate cyclase